MKVVTVLGTRPEVIKLAPVIAELRRRETGESVVVSTGQHREMLDQMLRIFGIEPDVDLDVMRPQQRLRTFEEVETLWETVVRPRFREFRTMQPIWSPQETVPPDSVWARNAATPDRS